MHLMLQKKSKALKLSLDREGIQLLVLTIILLSTKTKQTPSVDEGASNTPKLKKFFGFSLANNLIIVGQAKAKIS